MRWTYVKFLPLLASLLLITGCISYKAETNSVTKAIPEERLLNQIELGITTTAWLLDKFGSPQAVRRPQGDISIWQYENVAHSKKTMRALPLIAITLEDSAATIYNFEVENDFVVRYWKDQN